MDVNSELKDAQLEILDADKAHSANTKGMIWFNRAADKIKAFFNGEVKIIATEDWVNNEVVNSETNLKNNGLVTIEQAGTPATPDTGEVNVYAKDDGLYYINDAGTEVQLASATAQRVTDIITAEVNIRQQSFDSGSYSITAFTVPAGYSWSFVGVAQCASIIGFSQSGRNVDFDGKRFYNEVSFGDSSADVFSGFGVVGSGTNTGPIAVVFSAEGENTTLRKLQGIATFYKKQ